MGGDIPDGQISIPEVPSNGTSVQAREGKVVIDVRDLFFLVIVPFIDFNQSVVIRTRY